MRGDWNRHLRKLRQASRVVGMAVGRDREAYITHRIAGVAKSGRDQRMASRAAGVNEDQAVPVLQQGDPGPNGPELEDTRDDVQRSQDAVAAPAQMRARSMAAASGALAP